MKSFHSNSERIYQFLTRLYPPTFRAEYSEAMWLHFRDQLRDARAVGSRWALCKFWSQILKDTVAAAVRIHFQRTQREGKIVKAKTPSFWFLWIAFFIPLMGGVGLFLLRQPVEYMSMVRIQIENARGDAHEFLQREFETIASAVALQETIQDLGLEKAFVERGQGRGPGKGERLGPRRAADLLRTKIGIRQTPGTGLIEIRSTSEDSIEASAVADRLVDIYRKNARQDLRIEVIDRAVPSLRPVSPNVPMILSSGGLLSALMAGLGAIALKSFGGRPSRIPRTE